MIPVSIRAISYRNTLIFVITTIGVLPALLWTGGYYINGDIMSQMLPFVYETKRMFTSGVPLWSWNTYFGDNFIASYAYYTVFNPFTWINCLFPYKYLGLGFTIVLYLKFLVCGFVSQKYLEKIGFDRHLSLIGCLLYTFSSWAICNLYYYMFMEPMILFPLLLIFVERFIRRDKRAYTGLVIATFAVVAVNYYFAPVNLIAASLYFFCRILCQVKKRNEIVLTTLKAVGCVCLGILCASVILIPVFFQLKDSPQVSFCFHISDISIYADRVFWLLYPKTHEGKYFHIFLNWGCMSNAGNIAVFGLLPTLLLFCKKGYSWIKWLTVLMVILYLTPLNGVFSLFTDIYYSRWMYALTLAIIICTLFFINEYGLPRFKYALWYCLIFYGAFFLFSGASIYWQLHNGGDFTTEKVARLAMDVVLAAINAIALLMLCLGKPTKNHSYKAIIIAIVICASLQFLVFTISYIKGFQAEKSVITETEYFTRDESLMEEGDFTSRTNFKVMEPTGWTSCNFGLICNRPSIETYHSVQNRKIQKWKSIVSDTIHPKRVFYPANYITSFEALMSVKDLIVVSDMHVDSTFSKRPDIRHGIFNIFESDHYIPMGFAYDKYILDDEIEDIAKRDSDVDIPKVLLSILAIDKKDEKDLSVHLKKGSIDNNVSLDSLVAARRTIACDRFDGHTRGFDAHIELDSAMVVFFSVLADDGFKAFIDDKPTKIYETNLGFSSVIVPSGSHDISFRYFTPGLRLGMILSILGLTVSALMSLKGL